MKLSGLLFIQLLITCGIANAQMPLYDEAGRSYRLDSWQFDTQFSYYQATANYTKSGGEYVSLLENNSYSLMDFDFGTRWVPKSQWALYATSRVSNAESKTGNETRKESSLTQVVLGTDFLFYNSPRFDLYPDFSVTIPLQRVDPAGDTVVNGEGAMEVSGKLVGRMNWGAFDPFAFVGFTFRDEDRSSILPFGAGAELQFATWRFGAEVRGYQTVVHDKYENNSFKRDIVALRNGGALRYYSVDPSLLETNLWLRGNLTPTWAMKFGGGTSLTGSSIAAGWNVFAGLSYSPRFNPGYSAPIVSPYKEREKERDTEEVQKFEEEINDGVDQNLFQKPPPPPKPKPIPPSTEKKLNQDQQRKKLQNELDQTEFQIELKNTKKKKRRK